GVTPPTGHSITSSARASRIGGTSRPSAFAVLRLTNGNIFVGNSIGKSIRPSKTFRRKESGHEKVCSMPWKAGVRCPLPYGRWGAFCALGAFQSFITLFKNPLEEDLHVPIVRLQDALVGLEQGRREPILEPVRRRGRAPSSHAYASMKGYAAAT